MIIIIFLYFPWFTDLREVISNKMGGCSSSRTTESSAGHEQLFKVSIIDGRSKECGQGNIEVTMHELVLHRRGKESIRWPLWCLKRYGFNEELFSFESGRRGPNGPGIYAFGCRRSEALVQSPPKSYPRYESAHLQPSEPIQY